MPCTGTLSLPGVSPQGRLTWASQYPTAAPVLYVLDDTTKEDWGIGTFTPGSPATISRDTVLGNNLGSTAKLKPRRLLWKNAFFSYILDQNIEGVRRTAGKVVTISFWA